MFNSPAIDRRRQRWSWPGFAIIVVSAVLTIGVLLVIVSHVDAHFPKVTSCPSAGIVNGVLGTHVTDPTAVSESDVLGCFYRQGSDAQAVSVSYATATPSKAGPCRRRPRIDVSGHDACNVTGTAGTSTSGASLVVEAGGVQEQFTTDLRRISLVGLEALAVKVLARRPPLLTSGVAMATPSRQFAAVSQVWRSTRSASGGAVHGSPTRPRPDP
jgi:hypothetical protein